MCALQISTTTRHGFACPEAYVVIERGSYRKDTNVVVCNAQIYKDVASRDAGQPPIKHHRFKYDYDVNGDEMITQAYNALKLDPAMAGSIDV